MKGPAETPGLFVVARMQQANGFADARPRDAGATRGFPARILARQRPQRSNHKKNAPGGECHAYHLCSIAAGVRNWTTSVLAQTAHGETAGDQSAVFRGPSAPVLQPAASTDASAVRRRRAKAKARARTELRILRSTIRSSETRRRSAAERARDTETLRRSWPLPGLGVELYGDLGGSFGLNAPRLDNFGQTLERRPEHCTARAASCCRFRWTSPSRQRCRRAE